MDSIVLLFAVCLLRLWEAQGSSALTSVFVQKGKDLLLGVTEADLPTQINFLSWLFNRSDVLVTFSPDKEPIKYNERVEVFVGNYSIKLKNLQEADSGVYTVRAYGAKEHTETQYNVTVQDSVSPPQLIIDSVPTSSGSCNITVTCSTQDSHHINSTFTCDTQTCSQDIGEASKVTASGASLQVYLSSGSIICNHSNQVSWTTDMTINVCPQQLTEPPSNIALTVVTVVLCTLFIAASIGAARLYRQKRTKDKREETEEAVYAVPEFTPGARPLLQSLTNDASGLSPTSTYCLVGLPTGSKGSWDFEQSNS